MIINNIINAYVNRLMMLGVAAVGVGGFYLYDQYNKKTNFVPVQARITNVSEICYMEKKSGRTTETSDALACDIAQHAVKSHPKWQGFNVKYKINVDYDYVSPVDQKTHSGKRTLSAYPNGRKLARGEIFNVRASKTDPNKSREI